jgi:hypothetical protein
MNNSFKISIFLMFLTSSLDAQSTAQPVETVDIQVEPTVAVAQVPRFGVNLGLWTSWGAEQLSANVLMNPGFEGIIDRAIVVVKSASSLGFTDDTAWLARPDGFWSGALYDVRTGPSAGQTGVLSDSRQAGKDSLPEFFTADSAPLLNPGDVIALTRTSGTELPTNWWIPGSAQGFVMVDSAHRRPGSPGMRSLALVPVYGHSAEIISYLDAIGDRAGKMLPVNGHWQLRFWSCLLNGSTTLSVELRRNGSPPFFSRTFTPTQKWAQTTIDFTADDSGPPTILELHFSTSATAGRILLDDVELAAQPAAPGAFRAEVTELLKQLRPGYLRDWQGQLGDTLQNRLAEPFARRASRYRPDSTDVMYGYALPDFLDLCRSVGANPWIIIPPTFSDKELVKLGRFLASRARKDAFSEILVEFGNENWNPLFRPAGIPDPQAHGEAAERAFQKIRSGAGQALPLQLVVNGQHANPAYALEFAKRVPSADLLAVAPYFMYSLAAGTPLLTSGLPSLFAGDGGQLSSIAGGLSSLKMELGVYEVNLHTTGGDAPPAERDPLVSGAAAGSALAKRLLEAVTLGARRQCVYTLAGYDTYLGGRAGLVKLWGIVRDLGETQRLRPTGLALAMLNRAVGGDLHTFRYANSTPITDMTAGVFCSAAGWSAAVVSASAETREVSVSFPAGNCALPHSLLRLDAPSPDATNEDGEQVRIAEEPVSSSGTVVRFTVPPWGLVVLLP